MFFAFFLVRFGTDAGWKRTLGSNRNAFLCGVLGGEDGQIYCISPKGRLYEQNSLLALSLEIIFPIHKYMYPLFWYRENWGYQRRGPRTGGELLFLMVSVGSLSNERN